LPGRVWANASESIAPGNLVLRLKIVAAMYGNWLHFIQEMAGYFFVTLSV